MCASDSRVCVNYLSLTPRPAIYNVCEQIACIAARRIEDYHADAMTDFAREFIDTLVHTCGQTHRGDTVVTAVEANLSMIDAPGICSAMEQRLKETRFTNRVLHLQWKPNRMGVWTTAGTKDAMFRNMELQLVDDKLDFDWRIRSCDSKKDPRAIRHEVVEELHGFRRKTRVVRDPITGVTSHKTQLSGKIGGAQDDMCIAIGLCIFWANYYNTSPEYRRIRDQDARR